MTGRLIGMLMAALLAAMPAAAQKRIALTFDDAPRSAGAFLTLDQRTVKLIAALHRAGVTQAAFFVNPGNLADAADGVDGVDRLTDYVAAGHVLADHSYSHPALSKLTPEQYLADIDRAERWLKGREGYRAWFRYPFLDEGGADKVKRDAVRAGLKARGLANGYVTLDGSDWQLEGMTIAAKQAGRAMDMAALRTLYVDMMMQGVETHYANAQKVFGTRQPIHVMLMHETDIAALFIEDFVKALKAKGWTIATADAAYADPLGRVATDPAHANGTLTGQIAQTRGIGGLASPPLGDAKAAQAAFDTRVLTRR
ncbi:polysaccharide deacetylase family protein [Sphingomonas sp. Leaf4]|uniref:polysaccharide deacetylase family protein n=1 Tax=Sphingomonas sp. Leaf4 TaxID=2876553 RepID=UPI001E5635A4|nr:polysaccharide deacetylase family protein [Sphingomonas sp. Leaf4]